MDKEMKTIIWGSLKDDYKKISVILLIVLFAVFVGNIVIRWFIGSLEMATPLLTSILTPQLIFFIVGISSMIITSRYIYQSCSPDMIDTLTVALIIFNITITIMEYLLYSVCMMVVFLLGSDMIFIMRNEGWVFVALIIINVFIISPLTSALAKYKLNKRKNTKVIFGDGE